MTATCELIEILGREKLTDLQAAIGPAQTYIPVEAANDHPIAQAIGLEAMATLCKWHGGSTIWIGTGYANARRNEEIIQRLLEGDTAQNVAQRYGVTARYVRILANPALEVFFAKAQRFSTTRRNLARRKSLKQLERRPISRRARAQGMERDAAE